MLVPKDESTLDGCQKTTEDFLIAINMIMPMDISVPIEQMTLLEAASSTIRVSYLDWPVLCPTESGATFKNFPTLASLDSVTICFFRKQEGCVSNSLLNTRKHISSHWELIRFLVP